jgi:cytochrome-b5 reductase
MLRLRRWTSSASSFRSVSSFSSIMASNSNNNYPMILAERPAICSLVPSGVCQFNPTFQAVPLLDRIPCDTVAGVSSSSPSSYVLRFGLPDATKPMDLTTCACLLASAELMDTTTGELVDVIRPYTPISTNNQVGSFDLLIKDYGQNGWLSKYMCEDLPIGGTVSGYIILIGDGVYHL